MVKSHPMQVPTTSKLLNARKQFIYTLIFSLKILSCSNMARMDACSLFLFLLQFIIAILGYLWISGKDVNPAPIQIFLLCFLIRSTIIVSILLAFPRFILMLSPQGFSTSLSCLRPHKLGMSSHEFSVCFGFRQCRVFLFRVHHPTSASVCLVIAMTRTDNITSSPVGVTSQGDPHYHRERCNYANFFCFLSMSFQE